MLSHPTFRRLVRFADGDLGGKKKGRTAAHLRRCPGCREKVAFLRSLSATARRAPEPDPPAEALEEVLARRDAGDRVILPVGRRGVAAPGVTGPGTEARPGAPGPGSEAGAARRAPGVAAAAVVLAAFGALLFWFAAREATAGNSELRFDPEEPVSGALVRVEYRSGAFFPEADTLRLRARLRRPWDEDYNRGAIHTTVARLVREQGDRFDGVFRLPEEVVYGAFAVEDLAAERVDDNQRRLWELLVRGPDGEPLFAALKQRIADYMGRNWEVARQTARRLTELHPDRVEAWDLLAFFQRQSLGGTAFDTLRPAHRERYLAFHEELSEAEALSADQIDAMQGYWWDAGGNDDELDGELWRYWGDRLETEHPTHPTVLFRRENELREEYADDPDGRLEALEPVWRELVARPPSEDRTAVMGAFINNTLNVADAAEDPAWFRRWMERYRRYARPVPAGIAYRVRSVLDRNDLRRDGLRMLSEERARLESRMDAFRSLSWTRERGRVAKDEADAALLFTAGKALLAAGDTMAALDSLEVATTKTWNPEILRTLGEVRLAAGDTLGAVDALAAVSVDPGTPPSFADSALSLVGTGRALERWGAAVQKARERMARQVLARADPQPLPGPVRLRDPEGRTASLAELGDGRPLAVVFFSRSCPWAVRALPDIERAADWVGDNGGRLVVVTEEEPDPELESLLAEESVELGVLHDFRREATRAFSNFGSPHHYIVGGDGELVFQGAGADEISRIPLEVAALLQIEGDAAGEDPPR